MPRIYFGVEIEIYVSPKKRLLDLIGDEWKQTPKANSGKRGRKVKDRLQLIREGLVSALGAKGFDIELDTGTYEKWAIVEESLNLIENYWGIELVSNVMHTSEDLDHDLSLLFRRLDEFVYLYTTESCGTHVHVSVDNQPSPGTSQASFTLDQLRSILRTIALCEKPIIEKLPESRKFNKYAQPNISGGSADKTLQELYNNVPNDGWDPVFKYINRQRPIKRVVEAAGNSQVKFTSWNFSPILNGTKRTVEFRSPPGVISSRDAKHWVAFAVVFISGAISRQQPGWQPDNGSREYPDSDSLRQLLSFGVHNLPSSNFWIKALELYDVGDWMSWQEVVPVLRP
ncbi:putative amidoligase enzyme-domain-containing protein [Nemania abortiva]|nr:putative amidoligase enzyme-domain-containing protein [Nemania abortiva]